MAMAIFGLIFVIWAIASFISTFFYDNVTITIIGIFSYIIVGLISISIFSINTIIIAIKEAIHYYSQKKYDKEYAKYKEEVLDSKYCYMTFDEWKRKQEVKK